MTRLDVATLEAVEVLPGQRARVTVEGGQVFFLSPEETPRAVFLPETSYGAALLIDWRNPDAPSYHVPASLTDTVARYFAPPTVTAWTLEGHTLTLTCDHMGHTSQHAVTVPAPVKLTGRRSEALHGRPYTLTVNPEVPDRQQFTVSAFAWPFLAVMLSGEERKRVRLRRPLPTLAGVEALPDGVRLTLDTGEVLTVPGEEKGVRMCGPDYAPASLMVGQGEDARAFAVPDALTCAAVEAFRLTTGGQP